MGFATVKIDKKAYFKMIINKSEKVVDESDLLYFCTILKTNY
jgi:hypothetical protein